MKAKKQVNRKAIVISAALTALLLTGAGSAALASNWLNSGSPEAQIAPQPAVEQPPIFVTVEPVFDNNAGQAMAAAPQMVEAVAPVASSDQVAAAYEAQLDQAYQALQEAYAQIDALQSAQAQMAAQPRYEDDDEDEHEHAEDHERGGFLVFEPEEHDND